MVDGLRELGKTILLTTHYMDEAQQLADRIAILRSGELAAPGRSITSAPGSAPRARPVPRCPSDLSACDRGRGGRDSRVDRDVATIRAGDPQQVLLSLLTWADKEQVALAELEVSRPRSRTSSSSSPRRSAGMRTSGWSSCRRATSSSARRATAARCCSASSSQPSCS